MLIGSPAVAEALAAGSPLLPQKCRLHDTLCRVCQVRATGFVGRSVVCGRLKELDSKHKFGRRLDPSDWNEICTLEGETTAAADRLSCRGPAIDTTKEGAQHSTGTASRELAGGRREPWVSRRSAGRHRPRSGPGCLRDVCRPSRSRPRRRRTSRVSDGTNPWAVVRLFAVLAGFSILLITGRKAPKSGIAGRQAIARVAIRALVLFALGSILVCLGTPVLIVLPYYGICFLLVLPLCRLSAEPLGFLAAATALVLPQLRFHLAAMFGSEIRTSTRCSSSWSAAVIPR